MSETPPVDDLNLGALDDMPGHLIRRAQQISNAIFSEECGDQDLTSVQFAALFAIRAAGEIDNTRLAIQIAYDRATIGDVVERLQTKGWLRRSPSATDGRVKINRLTEQGQKVLRDVEFGVKRVQDRLLEPFADGEREVLLGLLRRLVHRD